MFTQFLSFPESVSSGSQSCVHGVIIGTPSTFMMSFLARVVTEVALARPSHPSSTRSGVSTERVALLSGTVFHLTAHAHAKERIGRCGFEA